MQSQQTTADRTVCHCLRIKESQIQNAVDIGGCQSLKDVMEQTRAGGGCTACHRRICDLLNARNAPESACSMHSTPEIA